MADNDFFPIPSTLPGEDPGNKVRFLKRTVSGTEEGVQAIVIVDKDDPTVGLSVGADGIEVDNKTLAPGAATSAAQATGNASLASIDGKAPALVGGRVPVDGSGVTQPVSGPLTDAELRASAVPVSAASLPLPSGAATSAAQTTGNASLSSIDGKTPALGQALAAASVPVVLPAAQVSALTPPAAITGFALESGGNLATLVSEIGATNETAPGSDTATAGLSGRLQRIAQRLTSLLALFPSTLGQTTKAGSLSVAVASDQTLATAGDVAHDGVDSGNPVKIGGVAAAFGSAPSPVAAGDRTNLLANRHAIPFILGGHPNVITRRDNYTSSQTDTAIVTVSAGSKIVVLRQSVLASNANSVDVSVRIGFGTANTPTAAGVVLAHPGIAKGSGVVEGNGGAILGAGGDDEDLRITCGAPTGGSIDVLTTYFLIES